MARFMNPHPVTVTIASGQTVSAVANFGPATFLGIQTPAALTGTAFTFQVSADGVTYVPLTDTSGSAVSLTVTTSKGYTLDWNLFLGWGYVKIVSGSAEGADRAILLTAKILGGA